MRRLNWESPQNLEDLDFIQEVYTEEFLERLKVVFGSSYSDPWWGIVDEEKPASAQKTDSRPLIVRDNTTLPMTIDVLAGVAVSQNGERIVLTSAQSQIPLADSGSGAINVVYVRSLEEGVNPRLNDYDILVQSRYTTPDDDQIVQIATLSNWTAFSSVEREKYVSLAVVTVQPISTGGYELSIDMTQNSYTWNRPWFSPVDIGHRTQIGTGTTTENNPHGLQVNDMVAGGLTLWQLLLKYGAVVAEDESYAKVPGVTCEQKVLTGSMSVDTTGDITGLVNAIYVTLLYYPTSIVRITDTATEMEELAGEIVPGTRILFFRPSEKYSDGTSVNTKGIKIVYTWVQTGHPNITTPQSNITISNAVARQAMIAGGLQLTNLEDETLEFADAGGIPKRYKVFVDASQTIRKRDQVIFCTKKLDSITGNEPFVISPWGPGKIKAALTGATSSPVPVTLSVEFTLYGKDTTGTSISETLTFTNSWIENLPGSSSEEPNQFLETTQTFEEVTYWTVDSRVDDGPNAAIMMWIEQDPVTSDIMADVLPLYDCFWDGTQILNLVDTRPINTVAKTPTKTPLLAAVEMQKDLAGDVILVSETRRKVISPLDYALTTTEDPLTTGWFRSVGTAPLKSQNFWERVWSSPSPAHSSLRIPLNATLPAQCTLISADILYFLGGTGIIDPYFFVVAKTTNIITGLARHMALGTAFGYPTPSTIPPDSGSWTFPDYHMLLNAASEAIDQNETESYITISYHFSGSWAGVVNARIGPTSIVYQEEVLSTTGSSWNLQSYIAEDFRQPLWMDGTQSTLSKDVDGLGVRDTYVSRPIPVAGEADTDQRLRFSIFGADNEASMTFQYRYADSSTGIWSSWITPGAAVGPHTIDLVASINKIQVRLNPDGNEESTALGIGIIHWSHS